MRLLRLRGVRVVDQADHHVALAIGRIDIAGDGAHIRQRTRLQIAMAGGAAARQPVPQRAVDAKDRQRVDEDRRRLAGQCLLQQPREVVRADALLA